MSHLRMIAALLTFFGVMSSDHDIFLFFTIRTSSKCVFHGRALSHEHLRIHTIKLVLVYRWKSSGTVGFKRKLLSNADSLILF